MQIDCKQCVMYESHHCQDCLVTALLHPAEVPLEIETELDDPLGVLTGAGLIPTLKFRPRRQGPPAENPADERSAHIA